MKKLFYILLFFLPVVVSAQFNLYKDSPLEYAWKYVGNAGFSAGEAVGESLAFSPSGQPYVAYTDWENFGRATVMKFDGTNWVNVGNAGFSQERAIYTSLAFSPNDSLPYVAYQDIGPSSDFGYATVMKFDGANWVNVGNPGFSEGLIGYTNLAFSPSGQLYMAFIDFMNNIGTTVMKFDGTNWVNVGNAGFSSYAADYISLAFNTDGQPYVAYMDSWNANKATAMTFDGTHWVNVGIRVSH
jgi:hypothetical protein